MAQIHYKYKKDKESEKVSSALRQSLSQDITISDYISAIIEYEGALGALKNTGTVIGSNIDNFYTVKIPVNKISVLSELEGTIALESDRKVGYQLDDARSMVRSDEANSLLGDEGNGVIVGFVDTGIDISHPSFKKSNGDTRILYLWDQ